MLMIIEKFFCKAYFIVICFNLISTIYKFIQGYGQASNPSSTIVENSLNDSENMVQTPSIFKFLVSLAMFGGAIFSNQQLYNYLDKRIGNEKSYGSSKGNQRDRGENKMYILAGLILGILMPKFSLHGHHLTHSICFWIYYGSLLEHFQVEIIYLAQIVEIFTMYFYIEDTSVLKKIAIAILR